MSSHFTGKEEVERTTRLSYLFSPVRPRSPGERRFRYHGYIRGTGMIALLLYFVYCNPEQSFTYTALRKRWGWEDTPPIFPQYLKMQKPPSAEMPNAPPPKQPRATREEDGGKGL